TMAKPDDAAPPDPAPERSGTLIETEDDIRQAIVSGQKRPVESRANRTQPEAPARALPSDAARTAAPFRPTARPPVARLTIFDDGKTDGEVIRIRDHRFTIGRTEGDLRIPFDGRISARHVEITHQAVGGHERWVVTDLQSTHGMFVRVSRTTLADKAEFLVGNGRYRFDTPQVDPNATSELAPGAAMSGETRGWDDGPNPFRPPALTEL